VRNGDTPVFYQRRATDRSVFTSAECPAARRAPRLAEGTEGSHPYECPPEVALRPVSHVVRAECALERRDLASAKRHALACIESGAYLDRAWTVVRACAGLA
jgi:hypothetical protein